MKGNSNFLIRYLPISIYQPRSGISNMRPEMAHKLLKCNSYPPYRIQIFKYDHNIILKKNLSAGSHKFITKILRQYMSNAALTTQRGETCIHVTVYADNLVNHRLSGHLPTLMNFKEMGCCQMKELGIICSSALCRSLYTYM